VCAGEIANPLPAQIEARQAFARRVRAGEFDNHPDVIANHEAFARRVCR